MTAAETSAEIAPAPAAIIKLGTADFRDRVITGYLRHAEPDTIVLRQLFPGEPVDIGVIDEIEETCGQITIYPKYRHTWTDTDRAALIRFFTGRWHDRRRAHDALTPPTLREATHA